MRVELRAGTSDNATWALLAGLACACLFAGHGMGFVVSLPRAILPGAGVLILAGAILIGQGTGRPRLAAASAAFLQMTLFTIGGVVLAYLLAARGGPLWDARLAAADVRLGFNWPAVFRAADAAPGALWAGGIAYESLTAQMVVCIVALSATRRFEALRIAVAAAIMSGLVTILISGAMPAIGNLFDPAAYRHLSPSIAWRERDLIRGLRDGTARVVDLGLLKGIVSFPSYHAALPVILAWAQRDVAWLRIVTPIWAGVTILATPLFGGHYGVDVLAGLVLAVAAMAIAPRLVVRQPPPSPDTPTSCTDFRILLETGCNPRVSAAAARKLAKEKLGDA